MLKTSYATVLTTLVLALTGSDARANCSTPAWYKTKIQGNEVEVFVDGAKRGCPAASALLRQNIDTGEVVRIPDDCVYSRGAIAFYRDAGEDVPSHQPRVHVDECVPPGKYRYGLATPHTCTSGACYADYFGEATVTTPLAADCTRTRTREKPAPSEGVPWSTTQRICEYKMFGCTFAAPAVVDVFALQGAGLAVGLSLVLGARIRRRRREKEGVPA